MLPGHMDVVKAAQLADMPVEEFRSLNPGYNRPVIIQATARQILLPVDKVDRVPRQPAATTPSRW